MLSTSACLKENSVNTLEEWVLVFTLFTTATSKLTVNYQSDAATTQHDGHPIMIHRGGEGESVCDLYINYQSDASTKQHEGPSDNDTQRGRGRICL